MNKLRLSSKEKNTLFNEIKNTILKISEYEDLGEIKKLLKPIDETKIKKPTILIPVDIMAKMFALTELSETEISWHGLVKRNIKNNTYLIYDILVFPQINSATSTETNEESYSKWIQDLITDKDPNKFDNLRMHGHSHVNMSVYSSAVDDQYQKELLTNIKNGDYYIFMVLNKKHEIYTLLYDYNQQIKFSNNEITIKIINENHDIYQWAKAEIEKKCRTTKKSPKGRSAYTIPKPTPEQDKFKKEKNLFNKYHIDNLDIDILYEKYFGGKNESK